MSRHNPDIQMILDSLHEELNSGRLFAHLRKKTGESRRHWLAGHHPTMEEAEEIMALLMLSFHVWRGDDVSIVADLENDPTGIKRLAKLCKKMKGGKR